MTRRFGAVPRSETFSSMWDDRAAVDVQFNSVISPGDRSGLKTEYVDQVDRRLIAPELELLSLGAKVLDFGCGAGRIAQWSLFDRLEYFGVDQSEKMIELATRYSAGKPKRQFFRYDGQHLPFESRVFDCVIAIWVLQHILDDDRLRAVGRELDRVLKPGGKIILIEQLSGREIDEHLPSGEIYKRHRQASTLSALFGASQQPVWLRKTEGFVAHGPLYKSLGIIGLLPVPSMRGIIPACIALDEVWYRVTVGLRIYQPDWIDQGLMIIKQVSRT
jgi:SAM-dependent methyltransferase